MSETSPVSLTRARVAFPPVRHAAIHPVGSKAPRPRPLFPRAQDVQREKREREAAMKRHPAGKGAAAPSVTAEPAPTPGHVAAGNSTDWDQRASLYRDQQDPAGNREQRSVSRRSEQPGLSDQPEPRCNGEHRVRKGDSLWKVAGSMAPRATDAQLQSLTERIYGLNRETIGDDPDLIRPGQSLSLPKDCQR